jgi:hypothetical protein
MTGMIVPQAMKQREIQYASLRALGMDGINAYRRAYRAKRVTAEVIAKRAERLDKEQRIIDRIALCVSEFKIEQIDSIGKAYLDLLDSIEKCKLAKQWSAVFSGTALRLKCLGMLRDNLHLTGDAKLTDEQIIARLGATDPHIAAYLKGKLGSGDAYSA